MDDLARGLRRWSVWHEEWQQEVASLAVSTTDGLVLIDPLDPPPEARNPRHVLLTVFFHTRSAGQLGAPHIWAPPRMVRRLHNRGVEVTDAFEPEDELPGGIRAFDTARDGEVVYWLPDHKAVVVGDVLLGAGAKPHPIAEPLRLCPERWLGKEATLNDLRESLRPLLDLPVEMVLPSHGEPILRGGKDALAVLLDPERGG
jgi:glyoxylase-like metal-dependent hydrolase (beta-lactamase superfamily II)